MVWDDTKPAGGEALSKGDDSMRENFAWLEGVLPGSLEFPGDEVTAGRAVVPRHTQASRDALTPVDRMWIVRTDKPSLEYWDDASSSWVTFDFAFVGQIRQLAFDPSSAPEGWLECDGSAVSRELYSRLFAVIGTAFGTGDGSTTFNLPDIGGRVPVGRNTGEAAFVAVGAPGGEKEVALSASEAAAHDHNVATEGNHGVNDWPDWSPNSHLYGVSPFDDPPSGLVMSVPTSNKDNLYYDLGLETDGDHVHSIDDTIESRDGAHSNVQPYLTLAFLVFAGE
jgi:microcystin-dependent protein